MRRGPRIRRAPAVAGLFGAVLVAMLCAQSAFALFTHAVTGGPLTIASGTLAAPAKVTAAQLTCRTGKAPEVEVSWSASTSSFAVSYSLERATSSNGTYTVLASGIPLETLHRVDAASLAASTTYYYRVSSVDHSWVTASASVSVKTLSKSCS